MATVAESAVKTAREYAEPLCEEVNDRLREARRTIAAARRAAEDTADTTVVQVRRHPFAALGIAAGVGLLVGCAIGFAIDHRPKEPAAN
jgi:ElaB/YqjD/DUF883 family membrane-anchored ribosome-binding protein